MVRVTILLATASALVACAPKAELAAMPAAPTSEGQDPGPAAHPQIGKFGFDETGMDRSVAPGDDFYLYANGDWEKRTSIPPDKSSYGMFTALQDVSEQRVRDILEEESKKPGSRIGAAFTSLLDEAGIEARGLAPIEPWLNQIRSLRSYHGYAALAAQSSRNGVTGLFAGGVGQDDRDSDSYITSLSSAGMGLPDRDMYLLNEPNLVAIRSAYLEHLTKMLALAGEEDAAPRARAILDFETDVANASWTREDNGDATKTYNKMSVARLARLAPGFDWKAYLDGRGLTVSEVVVAQPSAFTKIAALASAAPIQVLKDQLLVRSLDTYSVMLPKAIQDESFDFYGTTLNGTPENRPRWKQAVDFAGSILTDEVAKIYVAKHYPPESKEAMDGLVKNVLAALDRRIDRLKWMQPATKAKARAKLAAFTSRVGYPERWHEYAFAVSRDDPFGNALRASQWAHDFNAGKLGKPVYRWEWGLDPMTVNAQANFGLVAITFPAAVLQPPFFDPNADPAINYGSIGAVIGHEISHHFDDQGAKYDARGNLSDWWTEQDVAAFRALSQGLIRQYDAYEIFPGAHVKGEFTLGENIGDLAGVQIAYDAYKASLGGKEPPVLDGFTGDQRFFLGWAQAWRRKHREANLRSRLLTDPHAPAIQRVWIVRNFDSWYDAFGVRPGDRLYLAPEQRVRIW